MEGNAIKNSSCTQIEPIDFIRVIEEIAINISNRKINEDFANLNNAPPKLIEYINNKYGMKFPIEDKSIHTLIDILYVDSDGLVFPCKGVYPKFHYKNSDLKLDGVNLLENKAIDAINTEQFLDYFFYTGTAKLKHKLSKNNKCKSCKFFIRNCYPCPLTSNNSNYIVAENCIGYPISEICEIVDSLIM